MNTEGIITITVVCFIVGFMCGMITAMSFMVPPIH